MKAKANFDAFKEKYPNYFIQKGRAYVKLKRKYSDAVSSAKEILKNEFVSKNFKKGKVLN